MGIRERSERAYWLLAELRVNSSVDGIFSCFKSFLLVGDSFTGDLCISARCSVAKLKGWTSVKGFTGACEAL